MRKITTILVLILGFFYIVDAQQDSVSTENLLSLSFEDLINMEVTSVSKKAERLQDVPSSIYVVNSEDISRSSAQNLMQLLREYVPGYWGVANDYMNSNGFVRNPSGGSILILLDGTPMMDNQNMNFDYDNFDIPLAQIDRIEVIKGSGGTVYGANSASGVISIFTKNPQEQSKLFASAHWACPGKIEANLISTPVKNDKLATTLYGKYTYFKGFTQMDAIEETSPTVPKHDGSGDTTIVNRFTGDDNTYQTMVLGANIEYQLSDKMKLSAVANYSMSVNDRYFIYFPSNKTNFLYSGDPTSPRIYAGDSVFLGDNNRSRLVGNIRADYNFSDNHSLFARVSTNYTDKNISYEAKNSIVDFELQDNLSLGINQISLGANYRLVNYDISVTDKDASQYYFEPVNTEYLIGFFAQDKISLIDGKLNLYLGLKGENFSLINDKFYFSPMAKFSLIPNDNLTIWGGFTQSYTTPGYDVTNVEYFFIRANTPDVFYNYTYPLVYQGTYQGVYEQLIAGGADSTAAATGAQAFVDSPTGQQMIEDTTQAKIAPQVAAYPGHYNVAGINGKNTEPTSFQNYEIGFRYNPVNKLSLEANYYYTVIENAIGGSPIAMNPHEESKVFQGEYINAYYYGNYLKGSNTGLEAIVRYMFTEDLSAELSYTWFKYNREYQENDDFDISNLDNDILVDDNYPSIPEHTLRLKAFYTLNNSWKFSLSSLYSSAFYYRMNSINPTYSYERQRFDPLYGDGGKQYLIGGRHDYRFILNFRVDKYFMDNKMSVYVFGNDVLSNPFTEGINQFVTVYPRQVGRMLGLGISYDIK